MTVFCTGRNSILSRNHVGMSQVQWCSRCLVNVWTRRVQVSAASRTCLCSILAPLLGPCDRLRGSTRIVPVELCFFNTQHCSTEFRVPELLRTESCIPKTSGHNVGLPALYRPSTAETCLVMSSTLRPLEHMSARMSLPSTFVYCTTFRATRLCTNKKLPSTCLSLPRPWRCMTPKAALASLYTTVVHDCPQVSDYRLKAHCFGARLHRGVQLGLGRR